MTDAEVRELAGHCKRFPPVVDGVQLAKELATPRGAGNAFDGFEIQHYLLLTASKFPVTWDTECCGEWQLAQLTQARDAGKGGDDAEF